MSVAGIPDCSSSVRRTAAAIRPRRSPGAGGGTVAFVIVSGDSDFSPLVSKLKENGKHVIGLGMQETGEYDKTGGNKHGDSHGWVRGNHCL